MIKKLIQHGLIFAGITLLSPVFAETGFRLENFAYPYPLEIMTFESQQQQLEMAYMDVSPVTEANGQTVVLLHGKNFCAATWANLIQALTQHGYRVIAVDQIGFCKSSKPLDYQYSFHQLATNTRLLLDKLGVETSFIMGHSMGGMLAIRYALLYSEHVAGLMLVNPIGLEDWLHKGVPYISIDDWYAGQLKLNAEGIKRYQQHTYYAGNWRDDYDIWVVMLAGQFDAEREKSAWLSALIYDMILTQPVVHEFKDLSVPTWLFIGEQDNTAIGKAFVGENKKAQLGDYSALAKLSQIRIKGAGLSLFPELGHSPHIQSPKTFHQSVLKTLAQWPH